MCILNIFSTTRLILTMSMFSYFSVNCMCKDFVDKNSYENGKKRSDKYKNQFVCYVNHSSNGSDITNRTTNLEMQWSADACKTKAGGQLWNA